MQIRQGLARELGRHHDYFAFGSESLLGGRVHHCDSQYPCMYSYKVYEGVKEKKIM